MTSRFLTFVIGAVTPAKDREWVLGDTLEEFDRVQQLCGPSAARRWLRSETWRVLLGSPGHHLALRRRGRLVFPHSGDGHMKTLVQDARYAIRLLSRSPWYTAIAILTLAIGIGANSAMFAVVNAILLKPLPFAAVDRLMLVHLTAPDQGDSSVVRDTVWSYPKYQTFLRAQNAFEDSGLFSARDAALSGEGEPERVGAEVVTERYPGVLGVEPALGRAFTYEEANRGGQSPVAMIGHGLWTRRYGANPDVIGREIRINGTAHLIVGVLPGGFRGLSGNAQVWTPLGTVEPGQLTQPTSHSYYLVARRKFEVSERMAAAQVSVLGGQVELENPGGPSTAPRGARAASLTDSRADADVRRISFVLLGAVSFVLLIACVNLTSLAGVRAAGRRKEVAVRIALGASRGRIIRQFLVEGGLLSLAGATVGLAVAGAMLSVAVVLLPESDVFFRTAMAPGAPRTAGAAGLTRIGASLIGVDVATLAFTGAVACAAGLLVSLIPALQATSLRPIDALKAGARAASAEGLRALGAKGLLVTAQIALAVVLLAGAGLMLKSAARLGSTDVGVSSGQVMTMRVDLPRVAYPEVRGQLFFAQFMERVRAIAGVEVAGLGSCAPVSGGCSNTSVWFPPAPYTPDSSRPLVGVYWATPDYFPTLGIQLLSGRHFTVGDRAGQPKVVVVNEALARAFWPNEDPIGKIIAVGQGGFGSGAAVIGVVSNVRYAAIEANPVPDVYLPLAQSYQTRMRVFLRTQLDTKTVVTAVAREVRELDATVPLSEIKTMEDRVGDAMWRTRVSAWLLSTFAGLALLLTAIGVFGVMAQTVMQRTAEIGLRMALGAQRRDVLSLVLGRAVLMTGAGLAIGTVGALALTRLISALLYGVESSDPLVFVSVVVVLSLVALAACSIPARRAMQVDAVVALRSE